MKKILIWMTSMQLGGAERSLIGLLEAFDYSKVNVDLFLNRHEGELLGDIPKQVNLLPENPKYASLAEPLKETILKGHLLIAIARLFARLMVRIRCPKNCTLGGSTTYSHKYTKWLMPRIQKDTRYDLAISYLTPHYFVIEKINAKHKYAWIHQDYGKGVFDRKSNLLMWTPYDKIISISSDATSGFIKCFPELKEKVITLQNFLPVELIIKASNVPINLPYKKDAVNILSIGRFCWEKNFESIPEICAEIRKRGIDCYWYIIGFGGLENTIRDAIKAMNMQQYIHIVGKVDNPYPYIKNCTIYVQPSLSEGKAVTVTEAQILEKPVVITDYPTSHSQLKDGIDGIIAPLNPQDCAEVIASLLNDQNKKNELKRNCMSTDYSGHENLRFLIDDE